MKREAAMRAIVTMISSERAKGGRRRRWIGWMTWEGSDLTGSFLLLSFPCFSLIFYFSLFVSLSFLPFSTLHFSLFSFLFFSFFSLFFFFSFFSFLFPFLSSLFSTYFPHGAKICQSVHRSASHHRATVLIIGESTMPVMTTYNCRAARPSQHGPSARYCKLRMVPRR